MKHNVVPEELKRRAFKDAVIIDTDEYPEISDFLFEMAIKITRTTVYALKKSKEYKSISQDDERIKAVEELLQGLYDTIPEE